MFVLEASFDVFVSKVRTKLAGIFQNVEGHEQHSHTIVGHANILADCFDVIDVLVSRASYT